MTPTRSTSCWLAIVATMALLGCSNQTPWSKGLSEADRGTIEAKVSMARLSERHGQGEFAERIYRRVLVKDPKNQLAAHRLAIVAAKEGRYDEATASFENALAIGPPTAELLSDYGYCLYLQDDLSMAERVLRDALDRDPHRVAARNNLALVLGEQERFDEALAEFRKAVGVAEAYANLGFVQSQMGYYGDAEANLHRALSLNPELKPAAEALIQLAQAQGKLPGQARPAPTGARDAIARDTTSGPRRADRVQLTNHETADSSPPNRSDQKRIARLPRTAPRADAASRPRSADSALPWRESTTRRELSRQDVSEQQMPWRPVSRLPLERQSKTLPAQARLPQAAKQPAAAQDLDQNAADSQFRTPRQAERSGMVRADKTGSGGPGQAGAPLPWQRPTWQAGD